MTKFLFKLQTWADLTLYIAVQLLKATAVIALIILIIALFTAAYHERIL